MDYTGKKVLIVGMAKSGVSAAKLLHHMGAQIALYDRKSKEKEEGSRMASFFFFIYPILVDRCRFW